MDPSKARISTRNGFGIGGRVKARPCPFIGGIQVPRRGSSARHAHGENPVTPLDSYLTVGLATCFEKAVDGKLQEKHVIEPIAASMLECLANGAQTSYKSVTALKLEDILSRDRARFPEEFSDGTFCQDYVARCNAAARTWNRSHAQDNLMDIVPIGQVKSNFNFDLQHKRVMNFENVVDDDDNIKQDISIDVYGRKKEEEYAQKLKEEAAKAEKLKEEEEEEEEEEDDLDALLMG